MKISGDRMIEDSADIYWTCLRIETDDGSKKAKVFLGASMEFFWDLFKTGQFTDEQVQSWLDEFVEDLKSEEESIFSQETYYYAFATTSNGEDRLLNFLQTKVSN